MHDSTTSRARLVLRANAATSAVTGAIAVVAAGWLSDVAGIDHVVITRLAGVGLLLFAAEAFRLSTLPAPKLPAGLLQTSIGDIAWVLATPVVIALVDLSRAGTIGAIVIAMGVADFAIAQLWLRSKLVGQRVTATVAV